MNVPTLAFYSLIVALIFGAAWAHWRQYRKLEKGERRALPLIVVLASAGLAIAAFALPVVSTPVWSPAWHPKGSSHASFEVGAPPALPPTNADPDAAQSAHEDQLRRWKEGPR